METGHTRNVSNFLSLIGFVGGWGADYKPVKAAISAANITSLHPLCEAAVKAADDQKKIFDDLIDKRDVAFNPMKPLATRVVNAFSVIDLPQETVDGAITINHKIQGKRSTPKKNANPADPNAPNSISASQLSFDNDVKHFHDLLSWVSLQPIYNPNEADLKIAALTTFYGKLDSTNKAVINGKIPYDNKLDARDALLYAPKTGMVDIAYEVKKYAKSAFGATSARFKQVSSIKFTKQPRKK